MEPENESGPDTVAVKSEPVPLPTMSPESVVEPVPPYCTPSALPSVSEPPMLALPEVWSVPALVLSIPTPKPQVKYPEPPIASAAPVDGVVVAIARRVEMYC